MSTGHRPTNERGWISRNRLSPKSPITITRAEASRIMEAERQKIADASKDEQERICQNYQRRGGLLSNLNNQVATMADARKKRSVQHLNNMTPAQPVRRSERNSGKSSTSSVKSSQPLLGNSPSPLNLRFDNQDNDATPPPFHEQRRLSNIMEEDQTEVGYDNSVNDVVQANSPPSQHTRSHDSENVASLSCCSEFLCKLTDHTSHRRIEYTECINCGNRAHVECCEQFYVQTPSQRGPIPASMLSAIGKKRLKQVQAEEKESVMFCLMCKASMEHRRSKSKKKTKNNTTTTSNSGKKEKSAPKKAKKTITLSLSIQKELRAAAGFYCRSLVFKQNQTKADDCKSSMAKLYYGNPSRKEKAVIDMLVDGDEPFKDLYVEHETDDGIERILHPWLCGTGEIANYVPGVHFTADSISQVGQTGERPVTGRTLWDNSAETV